jgi:CIC family chloride channel protein
MTSVFMVLEVSGNYSIIVPVMISNTIAYLISLKYQPVPIFDVLSRQDGIELPSLEEVREEETLRVEDAMRPMTGAALRAETMLDEVRPAIENNPQEWLLIYGRTRGWTIMKRVDLAEKIASATNGGRLADILPPGHVPIVHPDNSIELPLRKLGSWPFLPVVHRAFPDRLMGIVSREDVLHALAETSDENTAIAGPS